MSRHLIDHRPTSDGGRKKAFYAIQRAAGHAENSRSGAYQAMRSLGRSVNSRLGHFLRIERGILA